MHNVNNEVKQGFFKKTKKKILKNNFLNTGVFLSFFRCSP